ncbi:MAG: SDR family NAD(P)-dependent oxidoreductase [Ignavibacteriales bacterium]|nr:SDR family NAD(P)-dependent oxidoreductase [Ignavibacteriales bacterium]
MSKILFIFGGGGELGIPLVKYLKRFDLRIILFLRNKVFELHEGYEVKILPDFEDENSIYKAFLSVIGDGSAEYHLLSMIGAYVGGKPLHDTEPEVFDKLFKSNFTINSIIAKNFIKALKNKAGGSITFISSLTASNPSPDKIAYGVSKNAINYLTKSLSLECRKLGISVNALSPGVIETQQNREWVNDSSDMIPPEMIAEFFNAIINNYRIISGNIIELPFTLKNNA